MAVYAMICIYCFALIRPVVPVINDLVAHVFYKMEHMATIHYENGHYHVHAELEKAGAEENTTKPASVFSAEKMANHYPAAQLICFVNIPTKVMYIVSEFLLPESPSPGFTSPPPRA